MTCRFSPHVSQVRVAVSGIVEHTAEGYGSKETIFQDLLKFTLEVLLCLFTILDCRTLMTDQTTKYNIVCTMY